jgi:simple sugar transport system permease protein
MEDRRENKKSPIGGKETGKPIEQGRAGIFQSFLRMRSLSVLIIFLLLGIVFTIFSSGHRFISRESLEVFLAFGSEFNIIALGVGMLMISGEFDLSVGSILVFCSFVFLKLVDTGMHAMPALLITLLTGTVIGMGHGMITVKARIPSFITTLGAMLFWRGLTLFWSEGLQKPLESSQFPLFNTALTGFIGGIVPMQFVWFVGIALILGFIVHFHKFGNWIFTTGDNKLASKAMGINTDRVKVACFSVLGFLCSFVAVMQIARVGVFSSRAGDGWELKAIAASVVGGTALTGGVGSIAGVFWGALIISVIENGLVVLRLPYAWTFTIFGVVLVSSVLISLAIEKRRLLKGAEQGR